MPSSTENALARLADRQRDLIAKYTVALRDLIYLTEQAEADMPTLINSASTESDRVRVGIFLNKARGTVHQARAVSPYA